MVINPKINGYKNYLVKSTGELLILKNIVRSETLWSNGVLEKEVIFHKQIWIWERLQAWSLSRASESTQFYASRVFFLSLFSCNFNDQLSPNFHRFVILCIHWVEIHQVRILVFDIYQKHTLPLIGPNKLKMELKVIGVYAFTDVLLIMCNNARPHPHWSNSRACLNQHLDHVYWKPLMYFDRVVSIPHLLHNMVNRSE